MNVFFVLYMLLEGNKVGRTILAVCSHHAKWINDVIITFWDDLHDLWEHEFEVSFSDCNSSL